MYLCVNSIVQFVADFLYNNLYYDESNPQQIEPSLSISANEQHSMELPRTYQ